MKLKTEVIRTRIEIDLFKRLKAAAEKQSVSMSAIIRQAIKKHVGK